MTHTTQAASTDTIFFFLFSFSFNRLHSLDSSVYIAAAAYLVHVIRFVFESAFYNDIWHPLRCFVDEIEPFSVKCLENVLRIRFHLIYSSIFVWTIFGMSVFFISEFRV